MKTWGLFAVYLLAVAAGAAIVAPWVYLASQGIGEFKFHDVLNRLLLLLAFGGALLILHHQRLLSLRTLGWVPSAGAGAELGLGAAVATVSVLVVAVMGLLQGAVDWDEDRSAAALAGRTGLNVLVAATVAIVEETFFRGCLLGWLRQRARPLVALVVVTIFYALVHFLEPTKAMKSHSEVTWWSGFLLLGNYAVNLTDDVRWVPRFVLLVLIGATLGWCFLRTSRLYLSVGLHAGWVFAGRELLLLTNVNNGAGWWFGSGKLVGSPITLAAVGGVFLLMLWLCEHPNLRNAPSRE